MGIGTDLLRGVVTASVVLGVAACGYSTFGPDSGLSGSVSASAAPSVAPDRGWSVSGLPDATDARKGSGASRGSASGPDSPRAVTARLTGYSWQDNTPAGSAEVSHPAVHDQAGGTGTYDDPITVAVGHSLASGTDELDWPPGTRFYFPTLARYGVAEDTCGDGPAPELKACHKHPRSVATHLDVWIGGEGGTRAATDACMDRLTGDVPVIVNPARGERVQAAPVFAGGRCGVS